VLLWSLVCLAQLLVVCYLYSVTFEQIYNDDDELRFILHTRPDPNGKVDGGVNEAWKTM